MSIVAMVQNAEAESRAIELGKSRRPVYLTLTAASLVPIFLVGLSMFSCQQRHYIESKWGGLVVLSSILIYSFGKCNTRPLTVRSAATDRERQSLRPTIIFPAVGSARRGVGALARAAARLGSGWQSRWARQPDGSPV